MRAGAMITSYGDKERDFLEALEADTGRTLEQWMEAIRTEGLRERNDIIEWLRRQGFRFSRASWLERVHHNGGKPIYAGRPAPERSASPRPATRPRPSAPALAGRVLPSASSPATPVTPGAPGEPRSAPRPAAEAYASAAANVVALTFADPLSPQITELTAKAKAYRPLADYILREIAKSMPGTTFGVRGQLVAIVRGCEFATLAISARELKLTTGGSTLALTDARQVDGALLDRLRAAAASAS